MSGSGFAGVRARLSALGAILCAAALMSGVLASGVHAAGEFEPNDTRDTAFGPLAGGTDYVATFETVNDVDWYVFYIRTYSQMEFSSTMVKCEGCYRPTFYLRDRDGKQIRSFTPGRVNEASTFPMTLGPGRYYLEVNYGDTGDRYRFRIDPAASLTTSVECGEAIVAKDAVAPLLTKVGEELAKSRSTLATRARAVRKAKKVVRKLKKRRWASRYTKRAALQRLNRAKRARTVAWRAHRNVQLIARQHNQTIAGADALIATYC